MNNDLISREALKKKLQARYDNGEEDFDKGYNIGIKTAMDLIDNAPTIDPEITNDDLQAAMTESYRLGYELAETKFKRPHSNWINHEDYNERKYGCNQCGGLNNIPSNFCPNCGVKMKDA